MNFWGFNYMKIDSISVKKIKNSRGENSLEFKVKSGKLRSKASVPSGASKGKHELISYLKNKGAIVNYFNKINRIEGVNVEKFSDLRKIEKKINRFALGANPVIGLEYGILKLFKPVWKFINKKAKKVPFPLGNVVGGGSHYKGRSTDFQEFLVFCSGCSVDKAIKINELVYKRLRKELMKKDKKFKDQKTDENAWAPNLDNIAVLNILSKVVKKVSKEQKVKINLGLDVAASEFYKRGKYVYRNFTKQEKSKKLTKRDQIDFISYLIHEYNLKYVEDPLHQEDFKGFARLNKLCKGCLIVGDDLTATNYSRVKKAAKCVGGVIIKPNQVGSMVEVMKVINFCKRKGLVTIVSHRSGETKEDIIADLAVGFGSKLLKTGVDGSERKAKLKRLLKISKEVR